MFGPDFKMTKITLSYPFLVILDLTKVILTIPNRRSILHTLDQNFIGDANTNSDQNSIGDADSLAHED